MLRCRVEVVEGERWRSMKDDNVEVVEDLGGSGAVISI